jgi:hypothetical protein
VERRVGRSTTPNCISYVARGACTATGKRTLSARRSSRQSMSQWSSSRPASASSRITCRMRLRSPTGRSSAISARSGSARAIPALVAVGQSARVSRWNGSRAHAS